MPGNLAELARAALTAAPARDATAPTEFDGTTRAIAADVCVRADLGFALLLHRRDDGALGEELYVSTRDANGAWEPAEPLTGGILDLDVTDTEAVAARLSHGPLLPGEDETSLYTARFADDDGYETVRLHTLLTHPDVHRLDTEFTARGPRPAHGYDRPDGPTGKALTSRLALFALFPGECLTVRARDAAGRSLGEPFELKGA